MNHSRISAPLALAASSMVSGQTMTFELEDIASWDGLGSPNNIVLIDTYNEYTRRGYRAREAAFRAGLVRFRPVVLTAVTTILGLLPMVFKLTIKIMDREILVGAPSSQWWTQLSSTIAGGLTFATILTLVATPAMLVIGGRFVRDPARPSLLRRLADLRRRDRGLVPAE